MESSELEVQVNELETRVERLRSLYDQYFMGIEKLEPLVPKKDVERRLAILRKEQIKNTGLRFKFQMIVQRYNTFITHWMRISRQIEEGRYKRDVMRAKRRFGIDPTAAQSQRPAAPREDEAPKEKESGPPAYSLSEADEMSFDIDFELEPPAPPIAPPSPSASSFGRGSSLDLGEVEDPFEEIDPFPKPREQKSVPKVRIAARPGGEPSTEPRIPVAPVRVPGRPTVAPGPDALRPGPQIRRTSVPDPLEAAAGAPRPGPQIRRTSVPDPVEAAPAVPAPIAASMAPRPPSLAGATAPPPRPAIAPAPPPASASLRPPPSLVPAAPPRPAPRPESPVAPAPAPAQPTVAPRPAAAAPTTAPRPPPRAPAAAGPTPSLPVRAPTVVPGRAPARAVGDLSDTRFGEIYAQYIETRRKHNESTVAITRDTLAKQLGESTARLKQKHNGKAVDFEVVVKDGKTVLRPVVK